MFHEWLSCGTFRMMKFLLNFAENLLRKSETFMFKCAACSLFHFG